MKSMLSTSVALAAVSAGLLIAAPATSAQVQAMPATVKESPFACDTLALDPVTRKRHFGPLNQELVGKRLAVREVANGYEFTFPNDHVTYQHVSEWANDERACCPFFDISVSVTREHGPLTMLITGRPGTKDFMRGDGKNWVKPVLASR